MNIKQFPFLKDTFSFYVESNLFPHILLALNT
jgi:hypothetical protein